MVEKRNFFRCQRYRYPPLHHGRRQFLLPVGRRVLEAHLDLVAQESLGPVVVHLVTQEGAAEVRQPDGNEVVL